MSDPSVMAQVFAELTSDMACGGTHAREKTVCEIWALNFNQTPSKGGAVFRGAVLVTFLLNRHGYIKTSKTSNLVKSKYYTGPAL